MAQDILFKTDDYLFSYRVAGILIRNGRVLLQKPSNDPGYAFPGGHVSFDETNAQTLEREFREEIGAEIKTGALAWVGELFFPWKDRTCHQICLYYLVSLSEESSIPLSGTFQGVETLEDRNFQMNYSWVDLSCTAELELYPPQAKDLLLQGFDRTHHFIYRETGEVL